MHQVDRDLVLQLLPERKLESHKGDYGKILLLCGSVGYTGAAALASMGALRVGAGLVFLGVPESIYEIEAVKLTEPIVFPLPQQDGMIGSKAMDVLLPKLEMMDAVLIGPGLGRAKTVEKVVCETLESFDGPVVLDADGINAMSAHKDILRGRSAPTILTPHEGEFVRFTGMIPENRVKAAEELANQLDVIVLLKGYRTVITDGRTTYINPTGNPGMAVGGSGDVLSGVITGLLGQGIDPLMSAACGAWLHGAAGDVCAEEIGQYGMLPTDMINCLPRLLI